MVEALLFAASEPLSADDIAGRLPEGSDVAGLLRELQQTYAERGVNLVQVAGKWSFRTAGDLSFLLSRDAVEQKRLSRAALETLAIIAYHQPVTRAEIEEIRGVATSKGTLDLLLETGWIRMRGRRRTPGRPVTYGTTEAFLVHFGLDHDRRPAGARRTEGGRAARRTGSRQFQHSRALRRRRTDAGRGSRSTTAILPRIRPSPAILRDSRALLTFALRPECAYMQGSV